MAITAAKNDGGVLTILLDHNGDLLLLVPGSTPGVPTSQQYSSDDVVPTFGVSRWACPAPGTAATDNGSAQPQDRADHCPSANISYDFGALPAITGYVGLDDFFSTDFSGAGGGFTGASSIQSDMFTQELQIQGSAMHGPAERPGGGTILTKAPTSPSVSWVAGFTSALQAETQSISIFGQADYAITDNLKATFGAPGCRTATSAWTSTTSPTSSSGYQRVDLSNSWSEVTPRLGLALDPGSGAATWDSMLRLFSAAAGFKSGGYNGIVLLPPTTNAQTPYNPETNWTYEVGIKTDLFAQIPHQCGSPQCSDISDLTLNATGAEWPTHVSRDQCG